MCTWVRIFLSMSVEYIGMCSACVYANFVGILCECVNLCSNLAGKVVWDVGDDL